MALDFPNIDPVALSLGPLVVRWYSLAYLAGFLGGWKYCLYLAGLDSDQRPSKDDIDDFVPWAILGVIFGGRLGYVLFYQFDLFLQVPSEIFKVWHGGMSFHGGMLGVLVALLAYPYVKKFEPFRLADMVCAAVPIGLFFGRIANFINGELYGRVSDVAWAVKFPAGGGFPRHPSQLYEAALEGALLFVILFVLIKSEWARSRPGFIAGVFLAGYGCFRGFIEFFRAPDDYIGLYYGLISQGQVLSLPMVLIGIGLMIFAVKRHAQPAG